jgi:hypothetical protein
VDLKFHEFLETEDMISWRATCWGFCRAIVDRGYDEAYQLAWAAAGSIFTGEH